MAGFWSVKRLSAGVLAFSLSAGLPAAFAEMTRAPLQVAQQAAPEKSVEKPKWEGFQLQELDEPLTPLVPKKPRTQAETDAVDAAAWLATGQLLESRSELEKAHEAYKKGLAKSPSSLMLVRKLMTLSLALNKQEEGIEYAQKAVELNPTDVRALRLIGRVLAPEDPAGAIKLFERALKVPTLNHESPMYVTLMLDLGILYRDTNRKNEAAECLAVVFDARQNFEKYNLDADVRKELRSNPQIEYEKLGQVFLEAGKSELALAAFQKAVESMKGSIGGHSYNLAQVYLQTKQPEKALAELDKYFAAQRQSKGRAAYELLGAILTQMGKPENLIPQLEELAGKDPRNTTLQFYLGAQYVAAKRLDDAEQLFKKGLKDDSDPEGFRGLIQIYRQQNKPQELIGVLTKLYTKQKSFDGFDPEFQAITENSDLLNGMLEVGLKGIKAEKPDVELNTIYVLAKLAGKGHKVNEASELYRYVISQRRSTELKSRLYDELGDLLIEAKQFGAASKMYEDASKDPDLEEEKANLLYQLSRCLEFDGKTQDALNVATEAQKNYPNQQPLFRFQEAWIHYHAAQYEKAIELYEKLISDFKPLKHLSVLVKQARFSLSNIHVQMGNIRKGEVILEEMYAVDPHDPGINNDLGYLYADQGKELEKAESMIQKAVKADPDNSAYLDSLAWVLYKRGKYPEALTSMEKALQMSQAKQNASDATLWDHLGDIQERLKNIEKAVEAWKKALASAKTDPKPDTKLIGKLEDKLKTHTNNAGAIKSEGSGTP
ncbi:MAG: Tetratricopeptide 2 repeat protein [Planctomycetaceae bacterium]|nr:Tetratricopeptide 2 repeat protein [Planctomycetaceae bacterium]